jgi:hypothetical protein
VILASLREVGCAFRGFQPDGAAAALDALADERTEEIRMGEPTRVCSLFEEARIRL